MTMHETSNTDFETCRQWQAHYQHELENFGGNVPPPVYGESPGDYRRRSCVTFKRAFLQPAHERYKIQYKGLPSDAFPNLEQQLLEECKRQAYNPLTVPIGEFREIIKTDARNGQKIHEFIGQESFVKDPAYGFRPGRRIAAWRVPAVDTQGRTLRNIAASAWTG